MRWCQVCHKICRAGAPGGGDGRERAAVRAALACLANGLEGAELDSTRELQHNTTAQPRVPRTAIE